MEPELHWMPVAGLRSGRIVGYELLLRLRQGSTLHLPSTHIEAWERSGEIVDVDIWVTAQAIAILASHWEDDFHLAVNLSGRSLVPAVADEIERMLDPVPFGIDTSRLVFELTECWLPRDMPTARRFVQRLRTRGCRFSLDDFGAGHARFEYLDEMPLDFLKIDGKFVRSLVPRPSGLRLFEVFRAAAREYGLTTIAEFVKDQATANVLAKHGVELGQGYHIGKPVPIPCATDVARDPREWRSPYGDGIQWRR